ncbi:MAG: hypothetical protein JXB23_10110 [Candidatus Aminicenantes bacterium]|nr:hypothetical protein [Candidatus Aminicenantes bacterium]
MRIVKVFQILVGIVFLGVLGIIALNLVTRSGGQLRIPRSVHERDPQKMEKKEEIDFYEARGDKENLRIRAENHYMGEDENYHLEGNVEIVFFDKSEGEDILLTGQEVIYDTEWTRFHFREKAEVRFKDLTIDVTSLEYDAEADIFRSDYPVFFNSERLVGSGQRLTYFLTSKKLELVGMVHLEMKTNLSPAVPIILEGNRFDFTKKGKQGKIDGDVRVLHGKSWVAADSVDFRLTADNENIRLMNFTGHVRASLEEGEEESGENIPGERNTLTLYSAKRKIECDELAIQGFQDTARIQNVQAKGGCVFSFLSASGALTQIEAETVEFGLDKEGEVQKFNARKQARIIEKNDQAELMRQIEGDEIAIKGNKNVLIVRVEKSKKARILTPGVEITAGEVTLSLRNNNLEAKKDVKVIFSRAEADGSAVGFFAPDEPVFITTQSMRFFSEKERFNFSGGTKLWQQKEMFFSEEMNFLRESGNVSAKGKIRASFSYKTEDGEEEVVEILSERMYYDSVKRRMHYEEGCLLRLNDVRLKADSVFINLDKEKGELMQITASKNVVIVLDENEGRGEDAVFEVKKDILVLTGNPVLIAKDKGKTEGAKLTFHISDGKIIVENKDRERSVTVIKS